MISQVLQSFPKKMVEHFLRKADRTTIRSPAHKFHQKNECQGFEWNEEIDQNRSCCASANRPVDLVGVSEQRFSSSRARSNSEEDMPSREMDYYFGIMVGGSNPAMIEKCWQFLCLFH